MYNISLLITTKKVLIEDVLMNQSMWLWKRRQQERERGTKELQKRLTENNKMALVSSLISKTTLSLNGLSSPV